MISPMPLSDLQKYSFCGESKSKKSDIYDESAESKEFTAITPFVLDTAENKKDLGWFLTRDLSWISICYNLPLYVYIMSNRWYYKNVNFGNLRSRRNFGKCSQMQDLHMQGYALDSLELEALRIDSRTRYYANNMEFLEADIKEILSEDRFNLKKHPVIAIRLTVEGGIQIL